LPGKPPTPKNEAVKNTGTDTKPIEYDRQENQITDGDPDHPPSHKRSAHGVPNHQKAITERVTNL